jgi:hypothetical protein
MKGDNFNKNDFKIRESDIQRVNVLGWGMYLYK